MKKEKQLTSPQCNSQNFRRELAPVVANKDSSTATTSAFAERKNHNNISLGQPHTRFPGLVSWKVGSVNKRGSSCLQPGKWLKETLRQDFHTVQYIV